ncbi:MAG: phage tail assembly protein [Clostridiales bacterium]|uniref:hypothetical protein n=1 Tax=Flavonifractor porci TaxID=3133422 RepID=UPI00309B7668|nr:phage tail assembly protein [Clostridiales bacterium]
MDTMKNEEFLEEAAEREDAMERETAADRDDVEEEVDLLVKFRKPYIFEDREYTEIDLHGLEDITAGQLEAVGRMLMKKRNTMNPATLEMTMDYANMVAMKVTGKPLEFFERLPGREGMKIKTTVVGFLYGGGSED